MTTRVLHVSLLRTIIYTYLQCHEVIVLLSTCQVNRFAKICSNMKELDETNTQNLIHI